MINFSFDFYCYSYDSSLLLEKSPSPSNGDFSFQKMMIIIEQIWFFVPKSNKVFVVSLIRLFVAFNRINFFFCAFICSDAYSLNLNSDILKKYDNHRINNNFCAFLFNNVLYLFKRILSDKFCFSDKMAYFYHHLLFC